MARLSARGSASGQSDPREPRTAKPCGPASHKDGTLKLSLRGGLTYTRPHDRNSDRLRPLLTDKQDLAAQRTALEKLGVAPERIYTDRGLTGANRSRPGLDQALAAVRTGDTLVVPKLDRLARSVPDARTIADALVARGVKLA